MSLTVNVYHCFYRAIHSEQRNTSKETIAKAIAQSERVSFDICEIFNKDYVRIYFRIILHAPR